MLAVKVLAFDTGGTIIDWHSGLVAALKECGARRGVERSWYEFANEYRRRALRRMIGAVDPAFNIDDGHREVLDGLLTEERIDAFSPEDRREITQRWHELDTWPDFAAALVRLRARYVCVSFTILSLSLVIDSARRNNIVWDAVIPCEMLRVYKTRPKAYRLAAKYLAFLSDAFNHLKVIGYVPTAKPLLQRAGITDELVDAGVVKLDGANAIAGFIAAAKKTRIWDREPKVRNLP